MTTEQLKSFAADIRVETLKCLAEFGSGHIGGCMSIADTLAVLYGAELKHDPANPALASRDRLVLSKGHAGPALYAALALRGFFPLDELKTLNQGGTHLPSHVDRTKTRGVDMTCGSLGQGLSAGAGMAFGGRLDGEDYHTFVILGDGECDEGQVWEAAMFARHHKLSHLIALIDDNKQQLDGWTQNVLGSGKIADKFAACGWNVIEVNGHDVAAIQGAIQQAKAAAEYPTAIALDTIKGYGAPFAEGKEFNHSMSVTAENLADSILKLRSQGGALLR
ncbi:MAG: transketolase [Oscillospiraceae bacterium]|jgi:transketolase|nr:transketolase [Oscillospiraceae bacterium]